MKKTKLVILALFFFVIVGIVLIPYAQFKKETLKEVKRIKERGQSLVGMMSLSSTAHLESKSNNSFLRELSQNAANREIAYCIIQNDENKTVILFSPENIHEQVPDIIKNNSLFKYGLIIQDFSTSEGHKFIEFAKPVFKDGKRVSTVRLGLKVPNKNFFSFENYILPAQILFFILLALVLGYYWTLLIFKRLDRIKINDGSSLKDINSKNDIQGMIKNLEDYLSHMKNKMNTADSQQEKLESHLKLSQFENNKLFTVFNAFDFGIILIDGRDMVFFINTYFLDLLGKTHDDSIDYTVDEVIEHEDLKSFIQQQNLVEGHHDANGMEMRFEETNPEKFYRAFSSNITDAEGAVFVKLIMMENISKEKEAEKSQQDFVNHIAHELRTPLTNIKAYNEMMMDGEIKNAEMQKEFFNTINDETNRLAKLISSILELAETEIGQLAAKKDMVKTDWLLEGCIEAVEAVAKEKNMIIERKVPDNFPKISGDKEMLKSALINILGNAVKYSPENGTITFAIKETDQMVVFEINDTGYGIDDRDIPHIFEKFFRSENDQVLNESGSGLGLAITAEIIKIHDGVIEVQSELGKGSRFTITIPKGDLLIG